jgi:hypothetical protein
MRSGNEKEGACNGSVSFEHGQRANIPSKGLFHAIDIYALDIITT